MTPTIQEIRFHKDYDGTVAAAMLCALCEEPVDLVPVDYSEISASWSDDPAHQGLAVVDFLYHPSAVLWVDHHATAFRDPADRLAFRPSRWHVYDASAPSCPYLILRQQWFPQPLRRRFVDLEKRANLIDDAQWESPEHATDLGDDHLCLSRVLPTVLDRETAPSIVQALTSGVIEAALRLRPITEAIRRLRECAERDRPRIAASTRRIGDVILSDQSEMATLERYLPFAWHDAPVMVAIYATRVGFTVSVGANPWRQTDDLDLGAICALRGGGGRQRAAGVPTATLTAARHVASALIEDINQTLAHRRSLASESSRPWPAR